MIQSTPKITPFLWFDNQAEEAAQFYTSIFKESEIIAVSRNGEDEEVANGRPGGTVMSVTFKIAGQVFIALNGGPIFEFTPAVSFHVSCDSQEEVDYYWDRLADGGDEEAQRCGWLKDKYGLSWQIVPTVLHELLSDPDPARSARVMEVMLQMRKLDINALKQAAALAG